MRTAILSFVSGLALGLVLAACAAGLMLYTPSGQNALRGWTTVAPAASLEEVVPAGGSQVPVPPSSHEHAILVPAAFASEEYMVALNSAVSTFNEMQQSNTAMPTYLNRIQAQVAENRFEGLFDLVYETKSLIAQTESINSRFKSHLDRLSAANQQTSDQTTRSLTLSFLTNGNGVYVAYQEYLTVLDVTLSGAPPTSEQLETLKRAATALNTQLAAFHDAAGALISHLVQSVNDILP